MQAEGGGHLLGEAHELRLVGVDGGRGGVGLPVPEADGVAQRQVVAAGDDGADAGRVVVPGVVRRVGGGDARQRQAAGGEEAGRG